MLPFLLNKLGGVDIAFLIIALVSIALIVGFYFLIPVINKKQYELQRENLKKREEVFKENLRLKQERDNALKAEKHEAEKVEDSVENNE